MIVTGKAEEVDRVVGLEIGADDYLTKPFGHRELVARIPRSSPTQGPEEARPRFSLNPHKSRTEVRQARGYN